MIIYKTIICDDTKESRHESAHTLLSDMLSQYTSHTYSEIKRDTNDKPYINGVAFSVSHSKQLAVVCMCIDNSCTGDFVKVSDGYADRIGVDVESVFDKDRIRCERIAKAKFTDRENKYLSDLVSDTEYVEQFAQYWTQKESFGKYTGVGLKDALNFDATTINDEVQMFSTFVTAGDKKYALSVCYNSKLE